MTEPEQCTICGCADCPRLNGLDVWCEPEPCGTCKRPTLRSVHGRERAKYPGHCHKSDVPDPTCAVVAAAYERGKRDGLLEGATKCV